VREIEREGREGGKRGGEVNRFSAK